MLNVFITVDTEVYPLLPNWRETSLAGDIARDIYGQTSQGDFGLRYQLQLLNQYGLKAVYFVEPLFASVVGFEPLREIVDLINESGQEVQLHLHPEWLEHMAKTAWEGGRQPTIREHTKDEQIQLIALALHNLRASGASNITAFRAGDYAANTDTLRALAKNGIPFDTSYNLCHLPADLRRSGTQPLLQPVQMNGVCEFPVSCFSDWPGHYRHAQVTACSLAELKNALLQASQAGWYSFVIVFHSFELLMDRRRHVNHPRPDWVSIHRFRRLCEFLASHPDKFRSTTFNAIDVRDIPASTQFEVITSSPFRTARRIAQQGVRRIWSRILS